ncbi:hypothetical protein NE237_011924 [Protea cynaroides]|uniref:Sec-independent protein translocase protein TATB, chloroplastic n=1 Tax=Protea cynaroides TaxID=273540 RepID=A0A9Q0JX70_9MAGN|nr:hypothetical protein NE237_011924 [Protea cynaroides]
MASITSTAAFWCSSTQGRSTSFALSASVVLSTKNSTFRVSTSFPQLGFGLFPPWSGLKHLGLSVRQKSLNIEVKRRGRGKLVYASLFGVGAPEALVIGVVALLVFGPKGLAEVARNLGKTLRAFQPTIRELQDVSREFKSTLEREIGLDDIPTQNTYRSTNTTSTSSLNADTENAEAMTKPNRAPSASSKYFEDLLKSTEQQKASATQQQEQTSLIEELSEPKAQAQDGAPSANSAYSTEDYLKVTEEQLKASATQQQEQTSLIEELSEPKAQAQDGAPSANRAYSTEDYLKVTEEQLKASGTQQQEQTSPIEELSEPKAQAQATTREVATTTTPQGSKTRT